MSKSSHTSRRRTPWEAPERRTPMQEFIYQNYIGEYDDRHPQLSDTGEAELLNSIEPPACPYCDSTRYTRWGTNSNGVNRYRCSDCGKCFTPITGTIFQDHKISISEWIEYTLNVIRYLSINADSWNNRNAFTTSRYWLEKLFMALEIYESRTLLDGTIWFDETYIPVRSDDLQHKEDGTKYHGISRNQMCIAVACTKETTMCRYIGLGKPTSEGIYETFKDHIVSGSTIIHDKERAHNLLVKQLGLVSEAYDSRQLKALPDSANPLNRVNRVHALLKNFLYAHSGFDREKLQGFLDLFCFVSNPPSNHLSKVELLLKCALNTRKTLKYRDFYNVKKK